MITDVNVNLSRWPFRRLRNDEPALLVKKLRSSGITSAWASSFDALLHQDLSAVNASIAQTCQKYGEGILVPFGGINPKLPGWEEDLRRCKEEHHMPGIRLYPNYHGYTLDDSVVESLLEQAEKMQLIVQIVHKMEDERTQHRLIRVPSVDLAPLPEVVKKFPQLRLVVLNAMKSLDAKVATKLVKSGAVYFDISMKEGVGGIEKMLKLIPVERTLFGSHVPFFYLESALLKMKESALGRYREDLIFKKNAESILKELG